jgi:hypothetical protein
MRQPFLLLDLCFSLLHISAFTPDKQVFAKMSEGRATNSAATGKHLLVDNPKLSPKKRPKNLQIASKGKEDDFSGCQNRNGTGLSSKHR